MTAKLKKKALDGICQILSDELGLSHDEAKRLFVEDIAPYVPGKIMDVAKGALGTLALMEAGMTC